MVQMLCAECCVHLSLDTCARPVPPSAVRRPRPSPRVREPDADRRERRPRRARRARGMARGARPPRGARGVAAELHYALWRCAPEDYRNRVIQTQLSVLCTPQCAGETVGKAVHT